MICTCVWVNANSNRSYVSIILTSFADVLIILLRGLASTRSSGYRIGNAPRLLLLDGGISELRSKLVAVKLSSRDIRVFGYC
jgi:hypothetical protein